MKRTTALLLLLLFLMVSAAVISLNDSDEKQVKKQCENNQQACPTKSKEAEGVNFMNPLSRFIVAA